MPTYSKLKRQALALRRKAIKKDIPSQYLAMADHQINKAIFCRTAPDRLAKTTDQRRRRYNRAVSEMLTAISD